MYACSPFSELVIQIVLGTHFDLQDFGPPYYLPWVPPGVLPVYTPRRKASRKQSQPFVGSITPRQPPLAENPDKIIVEDAPTQSGEEALPI